MMVGETALSGRYEVYPEYKDSGVEWLGLIPTEWELWKLNHAFDEIGSGTTPPSGSDEWYGGDVPWVTTGELRETEIVSTTKKITQETLRRFPTLRKYPKGAIAIAMYGATIGRLGIFGIEATTNQACCVLAKSSVVDNKYLYYWLQAFRQDIVSLASGGGQPNINQEVVASLKISSPDVTGQRKIANFLDHETAKIDTLIAKQQQLITLLKEKRQAVISHAVTKGLSPSTPMRDSGVEWLGEVPVHWGIKRLKNVLTVPMKNGLFKKKDQFGSGSLLVNVSDLYVDDYFIKSSTLDRVETSSDERRVYKVDGGDIFFVRSSLKLEGIGRSACYLEDHEDVVFECHIVNAKPDKNTMSSRYLTRYLNSLPVSQELVRRSKTTTMTTIDQGGLGTINVVTPPKQEQFEIDTYLDEKLEMMDRAEMRAGDSIKLLTERRTALISAAVTGKIDVRNWKAA
jgi:type I restriction enzyme S subunit